MKKLDRKVRRSIIVAVAVIAIAATSVATFAYWDNLSRTDEDVVIAAGEGVTLEVSDLSQVVNGNLVPSGVIMKDGDITSATLTYTVGLDKEFDSATHGVSFDVTVTDLKINGVAVDDEAVKGLLNFAFNKTNVITSGSATTVEIVITMNMPADEAQYNAIAGKTISFDVNFQAYATEV